MSKLLIYYFSISSIYQQIDGIAEQLESLGIEN